MLFHVVAMSRNRVIGKNNKLPWHFSSDLKHFKKLTSGQTVIMGRKTFESIGRPLPERENFVLTRSVRPSPAAQNVRFFSSFEDALREVKTENAFIVGGADLFCQTIGGVNGIYLTCISAEYEGDAFYPAIPASFEEISRHRLQSNPDVDVIFYQNVARVLYRIGG